MTDAKLLIGITAYRTVQAEAYARGIYTIVDTLSSGVQTSVHIETNMYVTMARNNIAAYALDLYHQGKCTHLWFLDDDMMIPKGAALALLRRDLPVVGGLYYGRDMVPVAYNFDPYRRLAEDEVPPAGLLPVGGLGCGCTLIRCDVLEQMAQRFNDRRWFQNSMVSPDGVEEYMGEDIFFFVRLHEMKIPVYLDTDVSCGHMGSIIVDREGVELRRRAFNVGIVKDAGAR